MNVMLCRQNVRYLGFDTSGRVKYDKQKCTVNRIYFIARQGHTNKT